MDKSLSIILRAVGATQTARDVGKVDSSISGLTNRAGTFAAKLRGNVGSALTTFGGRLKSAATGVAALAGVGGILGIGAAVEQSVSKLEAFSLSLEKVQTLTGETATDSGALILLFQKFGLSLDQVGTFAGFAEKTLGKLNNATAKTGKATKSAALAELERQKLDRQAAGLSTKKIDLLIKEQKATDALSASIADAADGTTKLQALDKQYGLALIDANGKTVSFSAELLQLADFYDRNHDAAQRAYVASTLLGRGYAALAPILDQGSAAIRQAAAEAAALGLGNAATANSLTDFRNTMRDLGQQVDVLQLSIGMALIPTLDDLAKSATSFVNDHRADIVDFFKGIVAFGRQAASIVMQVAGTLGTAWGSIPGPLRDFLVTGLVGDRTVKFLFGFSPIGAAVGGIEKLIVGAIGSALGPSIGKGIAGSLLGGVQKVWVMNPGFGAAGGAGGALEGAGAKAAGLFAGMGVADFVGIAALALVPVIPALVVLALTDPKVVAAQQYKARQGTAAERGINPANVPSDYNGPRSTALPPGVAMDQYGHATTPTSSVPFHDSAEGHAAQTVASALIQFRADERASIAATRGLTSVMEHANWLKKLEASWLKAGQTMHDKIKAAIAGLTGPNGRAAAAFLGNKLGNAGFGAGGYNQALAVLAELKAMKQSPEVVTAIHRLEGRLKRLKLDRDDLAAAEKIAQAADPKNRKLDGLNRIMADIRAHGDTTTRAKVQDLINAVKHQKLHTTVNITIAGQRVVRQTTSGFAYSVGGGKYES